MEEEETGADLVIGGGSFPSVPREETSSQEDTPVPSLYSKLSFLLRVSS